MSEPLKCQVGITFIKGVGTNLTKNLIAHTGSVEAFFSEKESLLAKIPGIGSVLSKNIASQRQEALLQAEKEIDFIEKNNIITYFYTDKQYPFRLKECADAPVLIYTKGKINLNENKYLAIVGTREPSDNGKETCRKIVSDIAALVPGVVIVSGLAYGIDTCAHRAAVDMNMETIGVVAHGLDMVYPATHKNLANKMMVKGGLLTEFPSGTTPHKANFVQRNRIIAGLCDAVLVVESKKSGGSLITANLGNDYNRDVFAVPGRVDDVLSQGCNALIKNNKAMLVESADDIIGFMNWEKGNSAGSQQTSLFQDLSPEEETVFEMLRKHTDGLQTNELSVMLNTPFSKISSLLLEMEFKNIVRCFPGNLYRIVR